MLQYEPVKFQKSPEHGPGYDTITKYYPVDPRYKGYVIYRRNGGDRWTVQHEDYAISLDFDCRTRAQAEAFIAVHHQHYQELFKFNTMMHESFTDELNRLGIPTKEDKHRRLI